MSSILTPILTLAVPLRDLRHKELSTATASVNLRQYGDIESPTAYPVDVDKNIYGGSISIDELFHEELHCN